MKEKQATGRNTG